LADKRDIGEIGDQDAILVKPKKQTSEHPLSRREMKYNRELSAVRVNIENYVDG
jgi:hypothetical protein